MESRIISSGLNMRNRIWTLFRFLQFVKIFQVESYCNAWSDNENVF